MLPLVYSIVVFAVRIASIVCTVIFLAITVIVFSVITLCAIMLTLIIVVF